MLKSRLVETGLHKPMDITYASYYMVLPEHLQGGKTGIRWQETSALQDTFLMTITEVHLCKQFVINL